jgi:hypothetical protein
LLTLGLYSNEKFISIEGKGFTVKRFSLSWDPLIFILLQV